MEDVPSPINFCCLSDAAGWEAAALEKRPWREQFFSAFSAAVATLSPSLRVLELGSGPGFLAHRLLKDHAGIAYVALDYSAAMHELATKRLAPVLTRVSFVERSFREPGWSSGLGKFGCIVTNQAVHELRHKRHALSLHESIRKILTPGGLYLVCDHFCGTGGMSNDQLYMSVQEQWSCLQQAGFGRVEALLETGGMVLHAAS